MKPADWLQKQWYSPTPPAVLVPLAKLFRGAVGLRRWAYRHGLKPVQRLPVPVIVVGNLTVGGTGKTPLTIWLAEFLSQAGYRPGIVSRGYGGQAHKHPVAVHADSDPNLVGDEPVLIAQRTACPVYVFPRRAEAGQQLLAENACDIVLADDGLQHYALARDIEIALIDGDRRFGNGECLPAGPLREPAQRLAEADLLVCRGGQAQGREFPMSLRFGNAVNLADPTLTKPIAEFANAGPLHAVAGIGFPGRFFAGLREAGLSIIEKSLPDHHRFTLADLNFDPDATVLMTEKDAVKCRRFADGRLWSVPLRGDLPAAFGETLLQLLKVTTDGQKTA